MIDVLVDELELFDLGFARVAPPWTGRPGYHPSALLKLYIDGDRNRVQSSRRLERAAGRNVAVMWRVGRPVPDDKTISDFRKDNGGAIRRVCAEVVALCRALDLLAQACVAIDGSTFEAVNRRGRNVTRGKMKRRLEEIENKVERDLQQLDTADRQEPSVARTTGLVRGPAGPEGRRVWPTRSPRSRKRRNGEGRWTPRCWRRRTSRSR